MKYELIDKITISALDIKNNKLIIGDIKGFIYIY